MKKKTNDLGVLATDFSIVNKQMKDWEKQRDKKGNIYKAFSEYILCLEDLLENEDDSYKRYLIEQEIKELKKEQKKYYVPSMLEIAVSDVRKDKKESVTLENLHFHLLKNL